MPRTRGRPGRTLVVLAILAVAALSVAPPSRAAGGRVHAAAIGERLVAGGLAYPAAFTFAPDGRIFYGERVSGEIRVINRQAGTNHLFVRVPNVVHNANSEQGVLGIALHPQFPRQPFVYAYATRNVGGHTRNQIVRFRASNGKGTNLHLVWSSSTTAITYHNGGHIAFGPGGLLYAVQGDNGVPSRAQNRSLPAGKVLRMTPAGRAAAGNPFGNRVFSYGLRNSFGFDFDPRTGRLWETENGPECNDELNRIVKGGNYAWGPHETCAGTSPRNTNQDGPRPRLLPKRFYSPTIAPTGAAFCGHCGLGRGNRGHLFFGDFNHGNVHRVTLSGDRKRVRAQGLVHHHTSGILSMEAAPGGALFFSDSHAIYRLVAR